MTRDATGSIDSPQQSACGQYLTRANRARIKPNALGGRMKSTLILLISLISATPAFAQVQATSLGGIVTDAQGAVLPGVTVTATSPALIGTQSVVSEPNGHYRFASVPEGVHTLTFELSGFQT